LTRMDGAMAGGAVEDRHEKAGDRRGRGLVAVRGGADREESGREWRESADRAGEGVK
jgi:hypothetical protein